MSPQLLSQSPRIGTDLNATLSPSLMTASSAHGPAEQVMQPLAHVECEEKEEETPQLSVWMTIALLVAVTVVR